MSMSRRPTGKTRGSAGTRSTTVGRPWGSSRGGHDAGRLVQQVVDEPGPDADDRAVDRDLVVLDVDPPPELGDLAVRP